MLKGPLLPWVRRTALAIGIALTLGTAIQGSAAFAATLPLPTDNRMYYLDASSPYRAHEITGLSGAPGSALTTNAVCASGTCNGSQQATGAFFNRDDASIYASYSGGNPRFQLYRIPVTGPNAGSWSLVGTSTVDSVKAMAKGPAGAFGIGQAENNGNGIYSVDLATGALTLIGRLGVGYKSFFGFTYEPVSGRYLAMTGTSLYEINVASAAATLIGTVPGVSGSDSLQADSNGTLWNFDDLSASKKLLSFTVTGNTISTPVLQGLSANAFPTYALVIDYPSRLGVTADDPQAPRVAMQQFNVSAGTQATDCAALAPDHVDWPGLIPQRLGGWGLSYADWPHAGHGGWVCTRQPYWAGSGWLAR